MWILSPGVAHHPTPPSQRTHFALASNLHFEHTPLLQCYALHLSFWLRTFKLDRSIWRRDQLFQTTWQLLWQLESLLLTFDLGTSQPEQKPFVVAKQDWALPRNSETS